MSSDTCNYEVAHERRLLETGGGTVDKTKNVPNYSFGGVVYPGCSPKAADGGNWNVVDHYTGLQHIIVDSCSGVPAASL
jgi:hypothetical protein